MCHSSTCCRPHPLHSQSSQAWDPYLTGRRIPPFASRGRARLSSTARLGLSVGWSSNSASLKWSVEMRGSCCCTAPVAAQPMEALTLKQEDVLEKQSGAVGCSVWGRDSKAPHDNNER